MERPGELFARMVLRKRQVRCQPAQLRSPVLQFRRSVLQRGSSPLAVRDVCDERDSTSAARGGDVIQAAFDREGRAVLPLT